MKDTVIINEISDIDAVAYNWVYTCWVPDGGVEIKY